MIFFLGYGEQQGFIGTVLFRCKQQTKVQELLTQQMQEESHPHITSRTSLFNNVSYTLYKWTLRSESTKQYLLQDLDVSFLTYGRACFLLVSLSTLFFLPLYRAGKSTMSILKF